MNLVMDPDGTYRPAATPEEWAGAMATDRRIDESRIVELPGGADVRVSTVFVGGHEEPADGILRPFETLVIGGRRDGESRRYADIGSARRGHVAVVESFVGKVYRREEP